MCVCINTVLKNIKKKAVLIPGLGIRVRIRRLLCIFYDNSVIRVSVLLARRYTLVRLTFTTDNYADETINPVDIERNIDGP